MYVLKNMCFVCLTNSANNLKTVLYKETEDEIFTHVKYALPELAILDSDVPVYICLSCSITLSCFYTFKKKCLANFSRWKHYIQILQETSDTQEQSFTELQLIKQEQELDIEVNIKENEGPIQTASDFQMIIDDNKLLIKQEPELHIISNINNKNEDAFHSSEEPNGQKTVVEDNIAEESLATEDNSAQEVNQQPEFVNVKCESVSDDEQGGSSSDTSVDKAEHKSEINNTDSQNLNCILCNEIYSDKSTFESHLNNHINNITGLKCLICKKTFKQTVHLKLHMKYHLGIKEYECSICHRKYANRYSLNLHMRNHRGPKKSVCEYCKKKFIHLKEHIIVHLLINNFECTICGKKFTTKRGLNAHLKRHAGIKVGVNEYECTVCNRKCTTKRGLRLHLKRHFGIKDYECSICSKKFSSYSGHKTHMEIHAGIKRVECKICNKKYVDNATLSKHMKYHLNVKNFKCIICEKRFLERVHLRIHMNFHLGLEQCECPVCKKRLACKSSMKRHIEKFHKEESSSIKT